MTKYDMKIRDQSRLVKSILRSYGHTVKDFARPWSPFDILMDGKIKIEVKVKLFIFFIGYNIYSNILIKNKQ